jgi:hypothetical protein
MVVSGDAKKEKKPSFFLRNRTTKMLVKGKKGKAIPVTGSEGPLGCEMSRFPHCV